MPLFEFLLLMVIIVTLYLGPMVLRRLGPGQRTYGWMLMADLALAILALASRKSDGPNSFSDLAGTISIGIGVCLVFVPPLLRNLARRALAADRMRIARWFVDMRELLQPGMGARQESELISTIIEVRTGDVDKAVARLRKQRETISEPVLRRPIDERIIMTYLYARRWSDASDWYESNLESRSASPQISVEMVRAYCERGDLDKAAELVEQLEGAGAYGEPLWTLLINRSRLVFLAFVGRTHAVQALMGPGGPLGAMPESARTFWNGVAQLRAGDTNGARDSLTRSVDLAKGDRRARELAETALSSIDEPGNAGPHDLSEPVSELADRLSEIAAAPAKEPPGPADSDEATEDQDQGDGEPGTGADDPARAARVAAARAAASPRLSGVSWRKVPVTTGILVINLLVAATMYWLSGSAADLGYLVSFGANVKWATAGGEYWRTVTSMFLHVGFLHLLLNMYGLWILGRLIEQFVGSSRTLVIYLWAGIAGSLASLWFGGPATSAGASGAVFGLLGAAVAELALHRDAYPKSWRGPLLGNLLFLIAANVVIGFMYPLIDQSAHVGGLIGGLILGAVLSRQLPIAEHRMVRSAVTMMVVLSAAVLAYSAASVARADFSQALAASGQQTVKFGELTATVPAHWDRGSEFQFYDPSLSVVVDLRLLPGEVGPGHVELVIEKRLESERTDGAKQAGFDRALVAENSLFVPPDPWLGRELEAEADGEMGGPQLFRVAVVARAVDQGIVIGSIFYPASMAELLEPTLASILAGIEL